MKRLAAAASAVLLHQPPTPACPAATIPLLALPAALLAGLLPLLQQLVAAAAAAGRYSAQTASAAATVTGTPWVVEDLQTSRIQAAAAAAAAAAAWQLQQLRQDPSSRLKKHPCLASLVLDQQLPWLLEQKAHLAPDPKLQQLGHMKP
jgi:hypothetical protein